MDYDAAIMNKQKQAVVLLSGGLDSTTTLAIAQEQGYEPSAITFRYGQRHIKEVDAALSIAQRMGVEAGSFGTSTGTFS